MSELEFNFIKWILKWNNFSSRNWLEDFWYENEKEENFLKRILKKIKKNLDSSKCIYLIFWLYSTIGE